jgi:hypothetical protein
VEHRQRVFENRMLRIFGPKRDDVTRDWRRLHNEEPYDLHSSPYIIGMIKSRMRWVGHMARMGDSRLAYRVLVEKTYAKSPLGRPRRRWIILKWIINKWDRGHGLD